MYRVRGSESESYSRTSFAKTPENDWEKLGRGGNNEDGRIWKRMRSGTKIITEQKQPCQNTMKIFLETCNLKMAWQGVLKYWTLLSQTCGSLTRAVRITKWPAVHRFGAQQKPVQSEEQLCQSKLCKMWAWNILLSYRFNIQCAFVQVSPVLPCISLFNLSKIFFLIRICKQFNMTATLYDKKYL